MIGINIVNYNELLVFWLIFSRIITIMIQLPIFDNVTVPNIVKILFSIIVSYAFFPYIKNDVMKDVIYFGANSFWLLTIYFTLIGLVIGFLVKSILTIFTSAGSIITQQVGFGAVRYFDPSTSQQVGPFEKIISWTVLIMIISSGALIPMMKGVFTSFSTISPGSMANGTNLAHFFLHLFKSIFLSALLLSSPMIFMNMLIMTVLGIVARTVPQMNIIMVSFVVNIGLGLMVFASSSQEFFHTAFRIYVEKLGEWFQFIV